MTLNARINKFSFLSIFLLLIISCQGTSDNSISELKFEDAVENNRDILLSNYATDIEYILLETTSESIMDGNQSDFMIFDSNIYIASQKERCVYSFDSEGNYLGTFKREGNGPEEYSALFDFAFENDGNGGIAVLGQKEVKRYTFDGKWVGKISIEALGANSYSRLFYLGKGVFAVKGNFVNESENYDKLILFDLQGNEIKSARIGAPLVAQLGEFKIVYHSKMDQFSNSFNVLNISSDTIFSYDFDLNMRPAFRLDCGKYEQKLKSDDFTQKLIFGDYYSSVSNDNLLIMSFSYPKDDFANLRNKNTKVARSYACFFYDKSTRKTYIPKFDTKYGLQGMTNDIDGGAPFLPEFSVGKCMYAFVDAIDFMDYAEISQSEQMNEVASKLTEESNPVIVKVTMK